MAARKGSKSPAAHLPDMSPTQGRMSTINSPPFRQSKPGRAPRKIFDGRDELDFASVDFASSPQPAVVVSSPGRMETAKSEPAESSKASALSGNWVKSEHEGLLTLHDGAKRWYHCAVCDYRNDRLYHSKMHYMRIHVKNGKSMPRKRKYADGPAGPAHGALPTAPRKVQSAEAPRAEVLGVKFVTPSKAGKKTGTTPPRSTDSPSKKDPGKTRQRLDFDESQKSGGTKARRICRNVKLFEKDRCDSVYPEDSTWSAQNAQMVHFREGSIICEDRGGSGWSVNVGEMNLPASLPPGRITIGAQISLRGSKKTPKKAPRVTVVKREEEASSPLQENADANWGQSEHPFEHSDGAAAHGGASASSAHPEGSAGKAMVTPGCSPMRPTSVRDIGGIPHTPLTGDRLRLISSSPDKYRSLRSNDNMMLAPTSNSLDLARSPYSSRRATRAGSQDLVAALHCNETMGDGEFGLGDLEAIDDFSASQDIDSDLASWKPGDSWC